MAEIPLSKGEVALVDDEDARWLSRWRWHITGDGYAARNRSRKEPPGPRTIYMHNEILRPASGLTCDHINRERLDNRRDNLRAVTFAENSQNKTKRQGAASRYIGVTWNKQVGRWQTYIRSDYLGRYDSEEAAAQAYDAAADERGWLGPRNFS